VPKITDRSPKQTGFLTKTQDKEKERDGKRTMENVTNLPVALAIQAIKLSMSPVSKVRDVHASNFVNLT